MGTAGTAGLDTAGDDVVFCVKEKSRPFEAVEDVAVGFGTAALVGRLSKKLPPLNGGGEVTCGAEGVAFGGMELDSPAMPEKAEEAGAAAGFAVLGVEKFNPPNALARPPNASCLAAGVEAMPPNDDS
jgi:hypothetical protein